VANLLPTNSKDIEIAIRSDGEIDISRMAVRLGRILDRLPVGRYALSLDKRLDGWHIVITETPVVRDILLER